MRETLWKATLRSQGLSLWFLPKVLFWLLSLGYSLGARINRVWPRSKVKVGVPVISIGNITVGGSGKTPLVIAIADALQRNGIRVGIVARGYGRSSDEPVVGVGCELTKLAAEKIGDEVLLMAEKLPNVTFAVCDIKAVAAMKLVEATSVDLVIVDDGFQHYRLHRDLEIVAVDATIPSRWLHPLPYGVLREPLSAWRLADLVVMTRVNLAADPNETRTLIDTYSPSAVRFEARFVSTLLVGSGQSRRIEYLKDKRVMLFAGIGNFKALEDQVSKISGTLVSALELSDHQVYDEATVGPLHEAIAQNVPEVVLTTAKDWVKLRDFDFGPEFYYLDLQLEFVPALTELTSCIVDRLGLKQRKP